MAGSLGVGVGLVLEEQARDVGVTLLNCPKQRRLALLVRGGYSVGASAGLEEALDGGEVS